MISGTSGHRKSTRMALIDLRGAIYYWRSVVTLGLGGTVVESWAVKIRGTRSINELPCSGMPRTGRWPIWSSRCLFVWHCQI